MSELVVFNQVPDRSRLEVAVAPAEGDFAASGLFYTFAGTKSVPDQPWTDAELQAGKSVSPLLRTRDYEADVIVNFASPGATSATVTARVVKPNGAVYGKVRVATVTGKNGDPPSTVTIVLVMEA